MKIGKEKVPQKITAFPPLPIAIGWDILLLSDIKYMMLQKARQHLEPAQSVIDLHIEKLTADWKHLGNYEIASL